MFKNYLLTAYKVFMRRKLFTAINLLCIIVTLVILMVVTALLQYAFYPTGVEGRSERYLQVMTIQFASPEGHSRTTGQLGYKLIAKYLKPMKSVEAVSALTQPDSVSVYQQGRISALRMRRTDAEYWKILDFKVLAGRVPSQEDVEQGRFVAVVNASTAAKLFPDTHAVGEKISVGGQQFEIIGVVEDAVHLNAYADIWVPVSTFPSTDYQQQIMGNFSALILAKNPSDLPQIKKEVEQIATTVESIDPKTYQHPTFWGDTKLDYFAREILDNNSTADSGAAKLLTGIVGLMLLFMLLPALNLVNLNAGRIMERCAEIGVRKAFGANNAQLVAQLVMENILLCLVGGLVSLAGAQGVLYLIECSQLIPYLQVNVNFAVFGYGLLITLLFGMLSGAIPAWKMSRLDPVFALKGAV